ncbi:putative flippase GtrA [Algibacter amylolyticus]|nr:putative flippase GtrA [Algibacter amylolyticus]
MKIINKETSKQLIKYIGISIIGYCFVFLSLYLLVDRLNVDKSISFMIVYGVAYVLLYSVQLKFLFNKAHNKYNLIRFCFSIFSFYILANIFYNIGIYLEINYLISTILTVIILMPLRFLVSKFLVFK